jgi:hypothetical protein
MVGVMTRQEKRAAEFQALHAGDAFVIPALAARVPLGDWFAD